MTSVTLLPPIEARPNEGGAPARRAVRRWGWRMFRREWRQQLLILALVSVAVAAAIIGSAVSTNTPPPANTGFGTAHYRATYPGSDPHLRAEIAGLRQRFGTVQVIESETLRVPGSVNTFTLRATDPSGPYGTPMLSLVSGRYPHGANEVALAPDLEREFRVQLGASWQAAGRTWRVVGTVENPQNLVDEFALVSSGAVTSPTSVTALFDAPGVPPRSVGSPPTIESVRAATNSNVLNPETITLAGLVLGMLLIALVSIGGFTVIAQRRLRALGMLESIGATDKRVRQVVRANGIAVGLTGASIGVAIGIGAWLAYRPVLESSVHHAIGTFAIPWVVVLAAVVLAVVTTFFAASWPARAITRTPVVVALSGRPAPPRQLRRSAVPGVALLVGSFVLFGLSGSGGSNLALVLGFVTLIAGTTLFAPFALSTAARLGSRLPLPARLALSDLARYRARSGSALAAISLGVLISVIVAVLTAGRYANVLDYAGPNLASNQVVLYTPSGPYGAPPPGAASPARSGPTLAAMRRTAGAIAGTLGATNTVELETTGASLWHGGPGRQWTGPVFVATPKLLAAFGIKPAQVSPSADILSMRPGLSGISKMYLAYGGYNPEAPPGGYSCPTRTCAPNPMIQELGSLPSGTSAPNTVITEHAIRKFGLHTEVAGWLMETASPPSAAAIAAARLTASSGGLEIETRNTVPSASTVINWATAFGVALSLAILAMSIGLLRSETARDLRTLVAAGASGMTRRAITASTAGVLALCGALLGAASAYVAVIGYSRSNHLDGLSSLVNVPVTNLVFAIIAMPLIAAAVGFLLSGREPDAIGRAPAE